MDESSNTFNKDFVFAIGRISLLYEHVEFFARQLIGLLISEDTKLNDLITTPISTQLLPTYLLGLFEYRCTDSARVEAFQLLVKDFRNLMEARHTNIHAVWSTYPERGVAVRYRPSINVKAKNPDLRGLKTEHTEHDLTYLHGIADSLANVASRLESYFFWSVKNLNSPPVRTLRPLQ